MSSSTKSIGAAIGALPAKKESLRKAYDELKSLSSSLSSFTLQWNDLEDYFTSIHNSIEQRFKELESKEKSSAAFPAPSAAKSSDKVDDEQTEAAPRKELLDFALKMNGPGLRSFVNDNRKDLDSLRKEISPAIQAAPHPAKLVLDAVSGFYSLKVKSGNNKDGEINATRRTCILLLERLHSVSPDIKPDVREEAKKLAKEWKDSISDQGDNSIEAWAFLQLLATYKLTSEFDSEEILDLIVPIARRKPTLEVCKILGIDDKIPDLIEKLNSKGKYLDAVKFVFAFNLVEKFPPAPLLKAHLKESKKIAEEVRKKGRNSAQSRNEATAKELAALKAVIKAVEEYNLGSEFTSEDLEKQVSKLEQIKAEKKRTAPTPNSGSQQQQGNKRARPAPGNVLTPAFPKAVASQGLTQLGLGDRANYIGATPYSMLGAGSAYSQPGSSYLGAGLAPGAIQSPPKSYAYAPDSVGASYYDRGYERPVAYDRPVSYDRPAAYDRAAVYGNYTLSGGLPPQYN